MTLKKIWLTKQRLICWKCNFQDGEAPVEIVFVLAATFYLLCDLLELFLLGQNIHMAEHASWIINIIIIFTRPKLVYGRQGLAGVSLRASGAQLGRIGSDFSWQTQALHHNVSSSPLSLWLSKYTLDRAHKSDHQHYHHLHHFHYGHQHIHLADHQHHHNLLELFLLGQNIHIAKHATWISSSLIIADDISWSWWWTTVDDQTNS